MWCDNSLFSLHCLSDPPFTTCFRCTHEKQLLMKLWNKNRSLLYDWSISRSSVTMNTFLLSGSRIVLKRKIIPSSTICFNSELLVHTFYKLQCNINGSLVQNTSIKTSDPVNTLAFAIIHLLLLLMLFDIFCSSWACKTFVSNDLHQLSPTLCTPVVLGPQISKSPASNDMKFSPSEWPWMGGGAWSMLYLDFFGTSVLLTENLFKEILYKKIHSRNITCTIADEM